MSLPASPSFKAKLVSKHVIVKLSLFTRAFPGTVVATDETGFCFQSDDMVAALREVTGSIMAKVDAPQVYLTFAALEWLRILGAQSSGGFSVRNFPNYQFHLAPYAEMDRPLDIAGSGRERRRQIALNAC